MFPLSDSAAVCGFEAFINGKHVVGQVRGGGGFSVFADFIGQTKSASSSLTCTFGPQVKEKETARKEYKQAVERGHGAYLMDQDAPVRAASGF